MAVEEKSAWFMGVIAIALYGVYLGLIFAAAEGGPISAVNYIPALLATVVGASVANAVLNIVVGIVSPKRDRTKDSRDRHIYRTGEYIGRTLVLAGAAGALVLAMLEADPFWIANLIYLAFVLAAVLASIVKIVGYRVGFRKW
jgi:uncharacterized membrane protein